MSINEAKLKFTAYRYHLVPRPPSQVNLFDPIDIQEIIITKNTTFEKILMSEELVFYNKKHKELPHKKFFFQEENALLLKLGNTKLLRLTDEAWNEEDAVDMKHINVVFYNSPTDQYMFVQNNPKAFQSAATPMAALVNGLNNRLGKSHLIIEIMPLVEPAGFWNIFKRYEGRIWKMTLNFTYNVLDNRRTFRDELKQISQKVNAAETSVVLSAPKEGVLTDLNRENQEMVDVEEMCQKGLAEAKVRVRGIRTTISTDEAKKTFEIDEVSGDNHAVVLSLEGIIKAFVK